MDLFAQGIYRYLMYITKIWLSFDCLWVTGGKDSINKFNNITNFLPSKSIWYLHCYWVPGICTFLIALWTFFCNVCNFRCSTTLSWNLCSLKYILCLHITPKLLIRSSRYCVVLPASVLVEVLLALMDVPTLSGMTHDV